MTDTIRVRFWKGDYDFEGEPDEVVEVESGEQVLWQDDPHYHSPPLGIDIHPDDGPATLDIYTSDSVHSPPGRRGSHVETGYWDGPVERGFEYPEDHDYPPFGCELWGRILLHAEVVDDAE